jgi:hypothetical protein
MAVRLTKEGRAFRNTTLKIAGWTFGALVVLRGCVSALNDSRTPPATPQQTSAAEAQPASTNGPDTSYPWENTPLGTTLTLTTRNASRSSMIVYINGERTVVLGGEAVTVTGVVVFNRRHKCKALRLESEDNWGHRVHVYVMLSEPTPASFFDCTPDE